MYTENYYTEHTYCCEVDEGCYACCCESTEHNKNSILSLLKQSSIDKHKVELVFKDEEYAEAFHMFLHELNIKYLKKIIES